MLYFDKNGNLHPYEPIPADMEILKTEFVDNINSEIRLRHYKKLEKYLTELKGLIVEDIIIWVNGSYVTKKKNPKDIDIVVFIPWQDEIRPFALAI